MMSGMFGAGYAAEFPLPSAASAGGSAHTRAQKEDDSEGQRDSAEDQQTAEDDHDSAATSMGVTAQPVADHQRRQAEQAQVETTVIHYCDDTFEAQGATPPGSPTYFLSQFTANEPVNWAGLMSPLSDVDYGEDGDFGPWSDYPSSDDSSWAATSVGGDSNWPCNDTSAGGWQYEFINSDDDTDDEGKKLAEE